MKVPLAGGAPVVLASDQELPEEIAVDATHVYWTTFGFEGKNGAVMKVPLDGGTPTALASDQDGLTPIAIDAADVYWVRQHDEAIVRVSKNGGTPTTLVMGEAAPLDLAVDQARVTGRTSIPARLLARQAVGVGVGRRFRL